MPASERFRPLGERLFVRLLQLVVAPRDRRPALRSFSRYFLRSPVASLAAILLLMSPRASSNVLIFVSVRDSSLRIW